MGLSVLLDIYDDIEGMTVSYLNKSGASTSPTVYNLDSLPAQVSTAQLPCRLLLPLGQGESGSDNAQVLDGSGIRCVWRITDLFLLETMARERGLYVHAPVMMRYVAAYAEALSNKYRLIHGRATLIDTLSTSITPGIYEYPAGSDAWFFGVKADITIEETF
jgi:hypothetical protein